MMTIEAPDACLVDTLLQPVPHERGNAGQPASGATAQAVPLAGAIATAFEQLRLRESVTRSLGC